MKKVICLLLTCIISMLILASCDTNPVGEYVPAEKEVAFARFQKIGVERIADHTNDCVIEDCIYYVDRYTNIIYIYTIDWDGNATRGMMTVLYNVEGKPMTFAEFEKEIKQ